MAVFIEDRLVRTIASADLIVEHVQRRAEDLLAKGQSLRDFPYYELNDDARLLPSQGMLILEDGQGALQATSWGPDAPTTDYSDRDYLRQHRQGAVRVLGRALRGRLTGTYQWTLSRRIEAADGSFAGVALAGMEIDSDAQAYRLANLGRDSSVTIFLDDATLLMRYPMEDRFLDQHYPTSPAVQRMWEGKDTTGYYVSTASPVDGVARLVVWRRIEGQPLVLLVTFSINELWRVWSGRALIYLFCTALALAPVVPLLRSASALAKAEEERRQLLERAVEVRTAELQAALSEAQRAEAAKTHFLAAASHDLRQPMQAIRLFTDLLNADPRLANHPALAQLDAAARVGEDLLRMLLHVSTLEAGVVEVRPSTFPLLGTMEDAVATSTETARAKGIALRMVPCRRWLRTDPTLLHQILMNLVGNAVKYTVKGRVLLGCRRDAGGGLRIEVWDSGPGIPADRLDDIFRDFVQLQNSARDRALGLGLGLSIVSRTARLLGMSVMVRSELGRGSVFTVMVPADLCVGAAEENPSPPGLVFAHK